MSPECKLPGWLNSTCAVTSSGTTRLHTVLSSAPSSRRVWKPGSKPGLPTLQAGANPISRKCCNWSNSHWLFTTSFSFPHRASQIAQCGSAGSQHYNTPPAQIYHLFSSVTYTCINRITSLAPSSEFLWLFHTSVSQRMLLLEPSGIKKRQTRLQRNTPFHLLRELHKEKPNYFIKTLISVSYWAKQLFL